MRFSEGSFAASSAATLYVAYLYCESSVRARAHFARQVWQQKKTWPPLMIRTARSASSPTLLLDDPDLDLGVHVGVEADRDAINAEGANRLVQVDLTLLDVEALRLQLMGDVSRGD